MSSTLLRSTLFRSTLLRSTQLLKLRSAVSTSKYTKLRGSGVVRLNREPERLLRDSEEYWRTEKLPAKVLCRVYTGGDTAVACLCVNRGDGGFPNIVMTYRVTVPFGLRSRRRALEANLAPFSDPN